MSDVQALFDAIHKQLGEFGMYCRNGINIRPQAERQETVFNLANKRNSIASITSEGIQKKLNALQKLTAELQNCPLDEAPLKRAASILQLQTLQAKLGSANEQLRIMQQEVQTAGTRADSMSAKAQEGASRNDALRKQITFYQTELASLKKSYIVASRKQARSNWS